MTTYPTLDQALEYGNRLGCAYWTLYEVVNGTSRFISENPAPADGTLDVTYSLGQAREFVNFYDGARPGTVFGIVFKKTKTSNGSGVYAEFRFAKDGNINQPSAQPQGQTPQMPYNPTVNTERYDQLRDKIAEEREAFRDEKMKYEIGKAMLERDIKDFEDKKKAYETELKELRTKFDDKVEIAKSGMGMAIGKILEEVTGVKTGGIKGVESKEESQEELTPEQTLIAEIAEAIDEQKYPLETIEKIKTGVFKIIELINEKQHVQE